MSERAFRLRRGKDVDAVSITVHDGRTRVLKPDDDGIVTVGSDQQLVTAILGDARFNEVSLPEPKKTKAADAEGAKA